MRGVDVWAARQCKGVLPRGHREGHREHPGVSGSCCCCCSHVSIVAYGHGDFLLTPTEWVKVHAPQKFLQLSVDPHTSWNLLNNYLTLAIVCSFVRLFFCSFVRLFVCSFVRLLGFSFFLSFVRSFVRSFVYSYVREFIHLIVCSSVRLFKYTSKIIII